MVTTSGKYVPCLARETRDGVIPTSGHYVPSFARNTHEYGIPTTMMTGLHNSSLTFGENLASTFSPYHASGILGNQFGSSNELGFSQQILPILPQLLLLSRGSRWMKVTMR